MNVQFIGPKDLEEIASWRAARGFPPWPSGWLSASGWWVPGVAAGWLVTTNSARAFLEDFIANPDATAEDRGAALEAIEKAIAEHAAPLGFRYLIGVTHLESVRARVRAAGYVVSDPVFSLHKKDL